MSRLLKVSATDPRTIGISAVFVACEARFERTVGVYRQLTACGAAAATWVWVAANAPQAVEVPKMLMFRCVASFLGHLRWMERSMVDRKSLGVSPKRGRFVWKVEGGGTPKFRPKMDAGLATDVWVRGGAAVRQGKAPHIARRFHSPPSRSLGRVFQIIGLGVVRRFRRWLPLAAESNHVIDGDFSAGTFVRAIDRCRWPDA